MTLRLSSHFKGAGQANSVQECVSFACSRTRHLARIFYFGRSCPPARKETKSDTNCCICSQQLLAHFPCEPFIKSINGGTERACIWAMIYTVLTDAQIAYLCQSHISPISP